MSKRIDLHINLTEITLLGSALKKLDINVLSRDNQKAYARLSEVIAELKDQLEQDELHSSMYEEDEEGEERLTRYGRESLEEKYRIKE